MRPDDHDIDDELRAHLEISAKERIARGEDPEAARLAALRELGYVPAVRESVHRVWYSRWWDALAALLLDMRVGMRSLKRAKGLTITVVITLALGIGANAAIFSVVRGVLLRPLVNRGEDRLVYIRQSAPGINTPNTTFSVAEINDLGARTSTIGSFGQFSTIGLSLLDHGEPRTVQAGVVGGSYFEVMGLRPVLGRLLNRSDDGEGVPSAVVLTHRFWTGAFNSDPAVIGRSLRLGTRTSTIVGVLEPAVPYPVDTEVIANMVTSPHHLGASMVSERAHRMTELFGRLAPGVSIDDVRAELTTAYAAMKREYPEAYSGKADFRISVTPLRDQITAPARTVLLLLLAAAAVVFVIACSNVANLILARSVRREGELSVRAALGASNGALRRTLLAESLVLCGAGAALGVLLAQPLIAIVARFTARFSVRALEVTVDNSVLWVGAGLAIAAAVLLAYVPRLPSSNAASGLGLAAGNLRITPGTSRRLQAFATAQIAFSFVLLAAAGMLVVALIAVQSANTGFDMQHVLAFDVPRLSASTNASPSSPSQSNQAHQVDLFQEMVRRVGRLPGVDGVAGGSVVPWRDAGSWKPVQFLVEGYTPADGEEHPFAQWRWVSPGFFSTLGIPVVAGREFNDNERRGKGGRVAIISQSIAQRLFPNGEAVNRKLWLTSAITSNKVDSTPSRIVGVVADVDDENVTRTSLMTIYMPAGMGFAGRVFVRASGDPYPLVPMVTRAIRDLGPDQVVERGATLEDIRAQVLTPERLNAMVVTGFAGIALLIAMVGVAGVLAFSVSARTREFGVRLAIGSTPRALLRRVLRDGALIVTMGIAAGIVGSYAFGSVAGSMITSVKLPGPLPVGIAAAVLVVAAVAASLMPAARAARVDVLQALRSE